MFYGDEKEKLKIRVNYVVIIRGLIVLLWLCNIINYIVRDVEIKRYI